MEMLNMPQQSQVFLVNVDTHLTVCLVLWEIWEEGVRKYLQGFL
jgi:hypothetical protein